MPESTQGMDRQWAQALGRLESEHDVEAILALCDDRTETGNAVTEKALSGRDGARQFWEEYRSIFGQVHSTYRNTLDTGAVAVLEWSTTATGAANGEELTYDGVTVIEHADGVITRFRAYFDSRHLNIGP